MGDNAPILRLWSADKINNKVKLEFYADLKKTLKNNSKLA